MAFTTKNLAGAMLVLALAASGSMALAKGHDQSQTATPGQNVQAETVAAAHTLGAALGGGMGPQ